MARIIGLDLVGPLIVYRICRSAGMDQVPALGLSGTTPALGVLIDYVRWRSLEVVGAVVLGSIALSIVLALVSGTTKGVLLEGAITTGAFGLVMLWSLWWRRPLMFRFIQAFYGGPHSSEGVEFDQDYDEHEVARSYFRTVTVVWGIAYLVEAAAKAVIVQVVSTGAALSVNRLMPAAVFVVLFAWTYRWGMRLRAQRETLAS